jgi:TonB family protein
MLRAIILTGLALLCADASAASRETRKRISTLEKQYTLMELWHRSAKSESQGAARDWRGRLKVDDLDQWAYTATVNQRVPALLEKARTSEDDAQANVALEDASQLIDGASARAREIANYWKVPSVSWRSRWTAFAVANDLPPEPTFETLLAAEQKVRGFLDSGDFISASSASVHIDAALESAIRDAGFSRAAAMDNAKLRFIPRRTPCPATVAASSTSKPTIARTPSPDDYYPPGSKRREDQGAIVVRAHIAPSNCATGFAVVVSSGYPELDQAALRVAEDSTYAAASEGGQAVEGYVTFKVKFTIRP